MKRAITLVLLFSLLLSGCAGSQERSWKAGQKALSEEKYSEAAAAFEKAGSYQDAEMLLRYAEAWLDLENGEYSRASEAFQALGDFKDSVLMDVYCQAREQEAIAQAAFTDGDAEPAVSAGASAYELYTGLSLFRDCDARAEACRDQLYSKATEWMSLGRYAEAESGFAALGDWQDCAMLRKYCKAAELEEQSDWLEAAELYDEITSVPDAAARAENARGQAYQQAADLMNRGDYEAAAAAFAALGSYRDAEAQRDSASMLQVLTLLRAGSYAEALKNLNSLSDLTVFPAADPAENASVENYLVAFTGAWMNAHAGVMTSFFSCSLLQPYLDPGGELDTMIRAELTDDTPPQNYAFQFLGAEVMDQRALEEGFLAAKVHGSASCFGPDGPVEMDETMWILLDTGRGNPIAVAALPL